jgi:hypothetical protein
MLSPEFLGIGGGSSSYRVANSLRFRSANSAYLSRTPAGAGNRKTWTWSAWVKRGALGGDMCFLQIGSAASDTTFLAIRFNSSDKILIGGGSTNWRITTAVFRDPSAWMHLVVAFDTTNATAGDRVKLWVNGTQVTAFDTNNAPTLNADTAVNNTAAHDIGRNTGATQYLDGHLTHVHLIDGQALTPSSFGRNDTVTGEWVPKNYSGSYGTNGFRLAFEDATTTTTIGADSSGNANNWTTSGISVTAGVTFDQSLDTPTNNYPTFDAVSPVGSASSIGTLAAANLTFDHSAANYAQRFGSFAVASGKWYFEYTITTFSSGFGLAFGIGKTADYPSGTGIPGSWTGCVGYGEFGDSYLRPITEAAGVSNTSGVASTDFLVNDIIMIAFDVGAGKFWMGKNGTWFDSGNPAAGTNEKQTFTANINWRPWCVTYGSSAAQNVVNFGQRAFAYSPPSGFVALNTANLAAPSIKRSRQYFDARLRTGTGAAASVSDLEFAPDLVWIKSRSAATTHNLFDTSRGAQKGIQSTGPNAEYTDANSLSAFASNGYSLGSDASSRGVNVSAATYVDWALKSGSAPGFNVTLYTGNGGGARNIAHGLGVAPQFALVRGRDARVWAGYHKNMTSAAYYLDLGTAAAEAVDTTMFDSTAPDASNFRVGSYNNANLVNYLAYLFTEVPGFSRIGVYTGNNNTDGPFVWCGFKPKFVMVKARDVATGWFIANPSGSANEVIQRVFSDSAGAEASNTYGLDLLAGGFKVRAPTGYSLNNSGNSYLFIAFADVPFKYSRAR